MLCTSISVKKLRLIKKKCYAESKINQSPIDFLYSIAQKKFVIHGSLQQK